MSIPGFTGSVKNKDSPMPRFRRTLGNSNSGASMCVTRAKTWLDIDLDAPVDVANFIHVPNNLVVMTNLRTGRMIQRLTLHLQATDTGAEFIISVLSPMTSETAIYLQHFNESRSTQIL